MVKKLKNICIEFKCAGVTASQVADMKPSEYNDSSWNMTRHNVAMAKGLVDPFSFFFTCNSTADEYKDNTCRIFVDKARKYKSGQLIYLATNFKLSRFYDRNRTIELFGLETTVPKPSPKKTKKEEKDDK